MSAVGHSAVEEVKLHSTSLVTVKVLVVGVVLFRFLVFLVMLVLIQRLLLFNVFALVVEA